MDNPEFYTGIIKLVGAGLGIQVLVAIGAGAVSLKLIFWRITRLEIKVEKHNQMGSRIKGLEVNVIRNHERIQEISRATKLQKEHK